MPVRTKGLSDSEIEAELIRLRSLPRESIRLDRHGSVLETWQVPLACDLEEQLPLWLTWPDTTGPKKQSFKFTKKRLLRAVFILAEIGAGKTQKDVAASMGISANSVGKIVNRSIEICTLRGGPYIGGPHRLRGNVRMTRIVTSYIREHSEEKLNQ